MLGYGHGGKMAILGKNKKEERRGVDLTEIIKGMQFAVNEAQTILERHHLNSLLCFFTDNGEPKTVSLHLEGNKYIDVPTFTLASHSALQIDELEMQFKARIQDVESFESDIDGDGTLDRIAGFEVGFTPDISDSSNFVNVSIKFKSISQSEGFSRVLDEYNKIVKPFDVNS